MSNAFLYDCEFKVNVNLDSQLSAKNICQKISLDRSYTTFAVKAEYYYATLYFMWNFVFHCQRENIDEFSFDWGHLLNYLDFQVAELNRCCVVVVRIAHTKQVLTSNLAQLI